MRRAGGATSTRESTATTATTTTAGAGVTTATTTTVPSYLHSVATIQLFVYLFVPILDALTPADLDNLKLANGLKIWEPLWSHRQPKVKIFNTPIKHAKQLKQQRPLDSQQQSTVAGAAQQSEVDSSGGVGVVARNRPSIQVSADAAAAVATSSSTQDKQLNSSSIYMGRIDEQNESKVSRKKN